VEEGGQFHALVVLTPEKEPLEYFPSRKRVMQSERKFGETTDLQKNKTPTFAWKESVNTAASNQVPYE
jgi:hypothetical protein